MGCQLKMVTMILLGESSKGDVSADLSIAPLEFRLEEEDEEDDDELVLLIGEPVGPLPGVAGWPWPLAGESEVPLPVGELADRPPPGELEEASEASEELLSESAALPSAS